MNYSSKHHSVSLDHHYNSVQYRPQSSFIYPHEQMININRNQVNQPFRPQLLSRVSESSSSSKSDIIDEASTETHSSDSEPLIIRYNSASSLSTYSRRVIIKSTERTVTIPNKPRRGSTPRFQKTSSHETESIRQNQSSRNKHQYSSYQQRERKENRLKRLFNEYSSEDVHREWKPLTFLESRELYQYASDKYHHKSRSN